MKSRIVHAILLGAGAAWMATLPYATAQVRPAQKPSLNPVPRKVQAPQSLTPAKAAPRRSPVSSTAPQTPPDALAWDSVLKQQTAKPGDTNVLITFNFTNTHSGPVVIKSVRPSCGCTTMELPSMPWTVPSGSNGQIKASLDLRGKRGVLTKSVMVDSSSGFKSLLFKVTVPAQLDTRTADGEEIDPDRVRNMQLAMVDRQVVFKNQDCAKCHAEPAHGKMGRDLYVAACAICHDTPNRATMVPELTQLKFPTSAPYWKYWISNGRPGSLMPAFAQNRGGPLTDEQIQSLVDYLTETISGKPRTLQPAPTVRRIPPNIRRPASTPAAPKPGAPSGR